MKRIFDPLGKGKENSLVLETKTFLLIIRRFRRKGLLSRNFGISPCKDSAAVFVSINKKKTKVFAEGYERSSAVERGNPLTQDVNLYFGIATSFLLAMRFVEGWDCFPAV